MRSRNILGGMLFAGLLAVGCGGTEQGMDEQALLDTREDAQMFCSTNALEIAYYSDATYTKMVGYLSCGCFETAWLSGRRTQFSVTEYSQACN